MRNFAKLLSESSWEMAFERPGVDVDEFWNAEFLVNRLIPFLLHLFAVGVRATLSSEMREETGVLIPGDSVLCPLLVSEFGNR
jgi:hypothetical protein